MARTSQTSSSPTTCSACATGVTLGGRPRPRARRLRPTPRVAVTFDPVTSAWIRTCRMASAIAADALASAGWEVEERDPPEVARAAELWRKLTAVELRVLFAKLDDVVSADALEYQRLNLQGIAAVDLDGFLAAFVERHAVARAWSCVLRRVRPRARDRSRHSRCSPSASTSAGQEAAVDIWRRHSLLVSVNLLGLPALALPVGVAERGLPQGVQLIADRYREDVYFAGGTSPRGTTGGVHPDRSQVTDRAPANVPGLKETRRRARGAALEDRIHRLRRPRSTGYGPPRVGSKEERSVPRPAPVISLATSRLSPVVEARRESGSRVPGHSLNLVPGSP